MQDALKRDLADARLLFRERVILAWIRVIDRSTNAREASESLKLGFNATQITLKSLYSRGYLKREKIDGSYFYRVH